MIDTGGTPTAATSATISHTLDRRVALVTGASSTSSTSSTSSRIGRATVLALYGAGATVFAAALVPKS